MLINFDDINREKLKNLFASRGQKITNPYFWRHLKESFGSDQLLAFQCDCGEIFVIHKDIVPFSDKNKLDTLRCPKCMNFDYYRTIKLMDDILLTYERELIDHYGVDEFIDFDSVNKAGKRLLPLNSHLEIIYSCRFLRKDVIEGENIEKDLPPEWYSFLRKCFRIARSKKNHTDLLKQAISFYPLEEILYKNDEICKKSDELSILLEKQVLPKDFKNDDIFLPSIYTMKEKVIRQKMITYRSFLENANILSILMSLVNIADGIPASNNPFKARLQRNPRLRSKIGDRYKNSVGFKVEIILSSPRFNDRLKEKFKRMYDTHLRNAEAHGQFVIDLNNNRVISVGNKRKMWTFDEIDNILKEIKIFTWIINDVFRTEQYKGFKHELKSRGIYEIVLNYAKCISEKEETFASIDIFQYARFNQKTGRIIPRPEFELDESRMVLNVVFDKDTKNSFSLKNRETIIWFKHAIKKGKIVLSLKSVYPTIVPYTPEKLPVIEMSGRKFLLEESKSEIVKIGKKRLKSLRKMIINIEQLELISRVDRNNSSFGLLTA